MSSRKDNIERMKKLIEEMKNKPIEKPVTSLEDEQDKEAKSRKKKKQSAED
jgi:hypothetical protein